MKHAATAYSYSVDNPEFQYYDQLHQEKYRDKGQTKREHCTKIASTLGTNELHQQQLYQSLIRNRFLPAGRVQAAMGAREREVSPFNCAVSQVIDDSLESIMDAAKNAALTLRLGTGIGYNFSHLRPKGALISKLQTESSGPLSFMRIFDMVASTIASSGHRRGAQMGIMNVDHPDIEAFIDAKMEKNAYRQFNLSVGISDRFMEAVQNEQRWQLSFAGKTYKEIPAKQLWEKMTRNAYDSAEPGLIFIDRLNDGNNLAYCEHIEATNPCAEQPLPPYGLCMLGSFNLPAYLHHFNGALMFDWPTFRTDIRMWIEAYDNIFDIAVYPLEAQKQDAIKKRRMGLGLTGVANCCEMMVGRASYGEYEFNKYLEWIARTLRDEAYNASADLAISRGPFKSYSTDYLNGKFIATLPEHVLDKISRNGIRNSHLVSYAPCGTISQCAGNVSSGVEPVFHHKVKRDVYMKNGKINVTLQDHNVREYNFYGKTLEECSVQDHMEVASITQKYCDSAVSKTVNVASSCDYEEYAEIYKLAHNMLLKGITVFRPTAVRGIVIQNANVDATKCTADGHCG